jgi:hypothetical protein
MLALLIITSMKTSNLWIVRKIYNYICIFLFISLKLWLQSSGMGRLIVWQMDVNVSDTIGGFIFRADFKTELFYPTVSHEERGIRCLRNIGIYLYSLLIALWNSLFVHVFHDFCIEAVPPSVTKLSREIPCRQKQTVASKTDGLLSTTFSQPTHTFSASR